MTYYKKVGGVWSFFLTQLKNDKFVRREGVKSSYHYFVMSKKDYLKDTPLFVQTSSTIPSLNAVNVISTITTQICHYNIIWNEGPIYPLKPP